VVHGNPPLIFVLRDVLMHELANMIRHHRTIFLKCKMAGVEQVNFERL